ncbi:MAG: copper oxidase [Nitrospira sp.]|nr:copper oxidase [Nitrospira sp.]
MKKGRLLVAVLSMLVGWGTAGMAQAAEPTVSFLAGDQPGNWFQCANTGAPSASGLGCVPEAAALGTVGQKSLAVINPGETVGFPSRGGRTRTVHTATSLIYPFQAPGMPFIKDVNFNDPKPIEDQTVTLTKPGLYVITCSVHPYMFAAVIVNDLSTPGPLPLDLGDYITIANGEFFAPLKQVPTSSDLATRLLRTFFIAANPGNWQNYAAGSWTPIYPDVPVYTDAKDSNGNPISLNLAAVLRDRYQDGNSTVTLEPLENPAKPGVGQVWVDTQFEKVFDKDKPGTATAVNAATWKVERKVALPQINMNNPHNMWTNRDQTLIYQTQWFDNRLAVFDRATGSLIRDLVVGDAPAHVMTRATAPDPRKDELHVTLNGNPTKNSIRVVTPLGTVANEYISIGDGESNPHAHWMSADGSKMVTPNVLTGRTSKVDFSNNNLASVLPASSPLTHPIATGMMPDASKYYVANFLDSKISVYTMTPHALKGEINLIANYDAGSGAVLPDRVTGVTFVGALPIQTPVSPDGNNMVTANTLTGTITVVDTRPTVNGQPNPNEDKVVKMLGCDPGCHGVNYGAKKGGGYYAYVSNKFSNRMLVVDPDPNHDGNPTDATVVGTILLTATSKTAKDGTISEYAGMGGQGVLAIPNVYNGWVQEWVKNCKTKDCKAWRSQLTEKQENPGPLQ